MEKPGIRAGLFRMNKGVFFGLNVCLFSVDSDPAGTGVNDVAVLLIGS